MPHEHHAAPLQRSLQLIEGLLDGGAVAAHCLLQLAQLQWSVGAEEDGFEHCGQVRHWASSRRRLRGTFLGSMWIGPKRSFWRTLIADRLRSSSTATKVTTASRRSSDSRISSTSSSGPSSSLAVIASSFSCSVQVRTAP